MQQRVFFLSVQHLLQRIKGIVMTLKVKYSTFWLLILFHFGDEFDIEFIKI